MKFAGENRNRYLCKKSKKNAIVSSYIHRPTFWGITAILVLLFLPSTSASAAKGAEQMRNYDVWSRLPNESLNRMAGHFLDKRFNPDSALLCYTIVANRYYTQEPKGAELHAVIRAMNNLGYLYAFYFFDYEKAYTYSTLALKISQDRGYEGSLPYIYQNLANIYTIQNDLDYNHRNGKAIMANYRKAFYAALGMHDHRILLIILNNLLGTAIDYDLLDECRREIDIFNHLRLPARTPFLGYSRSLCAAAQKGLACDWAAAAAIMAKAHIDADSDIRQRTEIFHAYTTAVILWRCGDDKAAIKKLKDLLGKPYVAKQYDVQVETYNLLYRICLKRGDNVNADRHLFSYLKTKEAMMRATKLGGIERVEFLGQLKEVNERVRLMSNQQRIGRIVIAIISFLFSVIILFAVLLYRKNKHLKEHNGVLYQRIQEMLETRQDKRDAVCSSEKENGVRTDAKEKYQNSKLSEHDKDEIMQHIEQVFMDTDTICADTFSLGQLSSLTGFSYKVVSQVINERYGKNFNTLLAERRICEACRRLSNPATNSQYTVAAIAASVGYKSYSTFTAAFRKVTGLRPSEYIKMAAQHAK